MYILSVGGAYKEDYTGYAVNNLDDVADLLLNEEFLSEYGYLFYTGITGFRYGERESRDNPVKLIVQYWNGVAFEEISLYLYELKVIGERK